MITSRIIFPLSLCALLALTACTRSATPDTAQSSSVPAAVTVARMPFGTLAGGAEVEAVVLKNAHGLAATVITYGAALHSLRFPDRYGQIAELAAGYDNLSGYESTPGYTNVTIGRFANRIAGGRFTLDGKSYQLSANEGPNLLHGGAHGWDKRNWTIRKLERTAGAAAVTFTLTSPDGDQGFPGTVIADVTYELTDNNDLVIRYSATTDKLTVINLTNHSMLNLGGIPATRPATDAWLTIESDSILPIDAGLIPSRAALAVAGTPFDFRQPARVADRIAMQHPQLSIAGGGIDHNYVLRAGRSATPQLAVRLEDRHSGRGMTIATTEPGMQVYTGNFLGGKVTGKGGQRLEKYQAITFEAQAFPDSPNRPDYPTTRLNPGQTYRQTTVHHFYHLK